MPVERMWPTCIGLATLGELKSMTTVRGCAALREEQMFAARRGLQGVCARRRRLEAEIEEAGARDLHLFAPFGHVQLRHHLGRRAGADSACRALASDISALLW